MKAVPHELGFEGAYSRSREEMWKWCEALSQREGHMQMGTDTHDLLNAGV